VPRFWSSTVGLPGPPGPPGAGDGVGAQTLDQVCNLGNTTDQDLKFQDGYINHDGPDEDSYLYFFDAQVATGAYLKWLDASIRFVFSHEVRVGGHIFADGNIGINTDASDVDAILTFYKPSSGSETLQWDKTSGQFEFSAPLSMESNKIVALADPTDPQDAVTKGYMDTISGVATQDLDGVCDIGSTTDQIIRAAQLRSSADIFVNYSDPAEHEANADGNIYFFHDEDPTFAWMGWDNSDQRFEMSEAFYVGGNIWGSDVHANGSLYTNYSGTECSGEVFFYTNGDMRGAFLQWDEPNTRFKFSNTLIISGDLEVAQDIYVQVDGPEGDSYIYFYENGSSTGAYLQWDEPETRFKLSHKLAVLGDLQVGANVYVRAGGPEGDSYVYFYNDGDAMSGWLKWSNAYDRIECSHEFVAWGNLKTVGDMYFNAGGPEGDGAFYFYEAGGSQGAYVKWQDSTARFLVSHQMRVGGHVFADRNIGVNTSASDNDAVIVFYKPSSGAEYLKWDKTQTRFELTDTLSMETHKIVNVVDPTANQDAATKKYVDDNIGTRSGPILIMDAMWLDDDSGAPLTSLLSGTYPALHDGDKISEAAYVFDSPWSIGIDLGVTRDVARIKLFDDPADQNHPADSGAGWGGIFAGGNYDSLKIYTADVNGAWTLRETIDPAPRLPGGSGRPCTMDIALSGTYSCRFVKLYCDLGGLCAVNGGPIGVAEIEAHYD